MTVDRGTHFSYSSFISCVPVENFLGTRLEPRQIHPVLRG